MTKQELQGTGLLNKAAVVKRTKYTWLEVSAPYNIWKQCLIVLHIRKKVYIYLTVAISFSNWLVDSTSIHLILSQLSVGVRWNLTVGVAS